MYELLLVAGLCGVLRNKLCATVALLIVIFVSMVWPNQITLIGLPNANDAGRFPAFFAFGALLAVHKDHVRIGFKLVAGLLLLAWLFRTGAGFQYAFYPAFLITALWLMSTDPIKALRLPGDFSYGVYVFGWPAQQTFASILPHAGVHANQALSLATATILAVISWYSVEKPCIELGRGLPDLVARAWELMVEFPIDVSHVFRRDAGRGTA